MSPSTRSRHQPDEDTWACRVCDVAWPCPIRRLELTRAYADAPVSLHLYLAAFMVKAAGGKLAHLQAGIVHDQFLGWLTRRGSPASAGRHDLNRVQTAAVTPRASTAGGTSTSDGSSSIGSGHG